MRPPITHPINDESGMSPVWVAFFNELLRNPLNVKTADYRVGAGDETIVLDGTSNTVTLTLSSNLTAGAILNVTCIDDTNAVTINLNGKTFYGDASNITMTKGDFYIFHWTGSEWVGFRGTFTGGVVEFIGLNDTPSTYIGQATKIVRVNAGEDALEFADNSGLGLDHLTDISNVGGNTHAQIDSHIGDGTIHFTEGSIDHTAIQNIGINSHAQIDTHIGDATIHSPFSGLVTVEYDEVVPTYTNSLMTQVVYKLSTATVATLTITYDSSDRVATVTNGAKTWTFSHSGTGFLSGVVKA